MIGEQNMTEAPRAGFFCTGKTPLELAISIHCQSKISTVLKEAGYNVGGCYTEILDNSGPEKIKRAGKTLEYLCRSNDVVFTLGCEGFAPGDVVPEITDSICTGSASYFTSVLCGARPVSVLPTADKSGFSTPNRNRQYPDDAGSSYLGAFRPRTLKKCPAPISLPNAETMPFADLIRKVIKPVEGDKRFSENPASSEKPQTRMTSGLAMRIFAGLRDRTAVWGTEENVPNSKNTSGLQKAKTSLFSKATPNGRSAKNANASATAGKAECVPFVPKNTDIKLAPSRARAGLLENALLLNFSNDIDTVLPLLRGILPAIGFSVYNLSGKSAASYAEFEKSLKISAKISSFPEFKHVVNE